jgi:PAS domain S-box-containing protein
MRHISEQPAGPARATTAGEMLQAITRPAQAFIMYVDKEERCLFADTAFQRHLADSSCAMTIGNHAADLFGASYALVRPYLRAALSGEAVSSLAPLSLCNNTLHAVLTASADRTDDGVVHGATVLLLTAPGAAQSARQKPDTPNRGNEAPATFVAQLDKDYRLRFTNSGGASLPELRAGDTIGLRIADIVDEEAFAVLRQHVDTALAGEAQQIEVRVPSQHAGEDTMNRLYMPERDEKGRINGLIAAISDITRLRRTEEKLHRREQEFKTLVENSPDIIARFDSEMRHLYVNPAVERAFGLPAASYLGKTKAEMGLPPNVIEAWDEATKKVRLTAAEHQFEFSQEVDGKMRHFTTRLIPEFDRTGNIESLLGVTYDVTTRTRMENEREVLLERERNARIQAETAARARDEFLAIVSHELRAPLNGIQSWAHVLETYVQESMTTSIAQRALQGIRTGVAQQVRLIEDLLDVTRMMSGKLRLIRQPLTVLPVLQAAVQSVRDMASVKRIGITSTYSITTEQVEGDSDRIQQIIWNLLSNAIKFTPEDGSVWLSASASAGELQISVRDNGVGIAPDFVPHLFDRFSQKDTSSTRGHGGLGLGLFLVRYLVDLHGGSVSVRSGGEGQGATFSVSLPMRAESASYLPSGDDTSRAGSQPSLNGLHILLVDDQEEARESLSIVLHKAGATVFSAASGKEALAWLSSQSSDSRPNLLICDIAMPDEDGYSVLRRIRTWSAQDGSTPFSRLPALALTAFSQREDRIRALTAGFQMHMTKPVAPEELLVVIDTMAARAHE